MESSTSNDRQNVSFKFSKISTKTLSGNRLDDVSKEYVTAVDKSEIKSIFSKPKQKELVIPLIKKNNWRNIKDSQKELTEEETKIKDLAVQELLKETSEKNAQWENREFDNYTVTIPLLMQNKMPGRFDESGRLDTSYRPEEPQLDDYEQVPVEQYGLAMLRGMGANEEDIKKAKGLEQVQVQRRIVGLGLGADTSAWKKAQKKAEEEKLELKNGAYVNVIQGPHKGVYGQVLGLDGENARVIVKLSKDDQTVTLPEFFIGVVSKSEFEKESKVINRAAYEKYKRSNEEKYEDHSSKRRKEDSSSKYYKDESNRKDNYEKDSRRSEKKAKRRHSREHSEEPMYETKTTKPWVRPQLRVRFIDDKYKKGKYFNKKVVVVDVPSSKHCSCKTEDNKYLDDISPSMLETVIPRDESAFVMIVKGKYSGELCTILKKDKSKCMAVVQFLSDREQAMKVEYDSICEYVGDVAQFD
ncbi:hypothetical protein JTE90_029662 [Oedothorax gibbosus]|uniref:KOW domain-containing protein n=1 Tax=Oedothorax gibbosus TaxID=931172 RepID=A0AAV6VG80_9ARAC|nr:hypothetical protein JTE90_029662 [Oedothorax gibbosus]